jgi:hypothetical protein
MSAMTDIIDRLRLSGDDEAADALSHARHAVQELRRYLTAEEAKVEELRKVCLHKNILIEKLITQRDRLRSAIEPFATEADNPEWNDMADHNQAISFCQFSVDNLRAARAAYEETGEKTE